MEVLSSLGPRELRALKKKKSTTPVDRIGLDAAGLSPDAPPEERLKFYQRNFPSAQHTRLLEGLVLLDPSLLELVI